ncbi:MAG: DUF3106 domain-containing protein [Caldimonas sp.]|uniref:DUF3106 domain-containing protein n=1 Tax=Caldimonas sp. TaxID=2838790 RepID=UPI00391C732A
MMRRLASSLAGLLTAVLCAVGGGWVAGLPLPALAQAAASDGPRWSRLSPAQQEALAPLRSEWNRLDGARKRKWLEIAERFPRMNADERRRVHQRMLEWVRLSPQQRTLARINFQSIHELPAAERLNRWETYQALPPEERRALAAQARTAGPAAPTIPPSDRRNLGRERPGLVPPPAASRVAPQPVAPTTAQVRPGATTIPITQQPMPPWHQQAGLPKIATSPSFVHPKTLLPLAGPQGAAVVVPPSRSAAPSTRPTAP